MGMTTGDGVRIGRPRGDPGRGGWIAGSTAVLLLLTALIGLPLLVSGDGWSAWRVEPHADGSATLRIRDLRDASGLERRLGEAGIPAHVTFAPEGIRCADGTGPVDSAAVAVTDTEDAILIHIGRIGGESRLALVAFLRVGGDVAIEAAVVPVERGRCALQPI
jgi:hypothetical protein